jgi:uncharacterized repeat protein (TIGR03803 family)
MGSTQQEITRKVAMKGRLTSAWAADWWKRLGILCLIVALTAMVSPGQDGKPSIPTFATLHSFDGTDGALPAAGLAQATNGNLYGTAFAGGANDGGTIFKITPGGILTTLYNFCSQGGSSCTDGALPLAGLVQATDGDFYGTTLEGGANDKHLCNDGFGGGCGTIFKTTPAGVLTTLYSFCSQSGCTDGANPLAGLVQATDGNFYGTTQSGGANLCGGYGCGTVFKITPGGMLTTLHTFCSESGCADGANPLAGLVQATDGNFYGTTQSGGANGSGTVFKITPSGTLTTLHTFCSESRCADGIYPYAGLVQATNGYLYGTTQQGGTADYGTVFKITPGGTLTTLYSFCSQSGCTDGFYPMAALVQATDGNLYGTTGGGSGTVFKITPSGTLTTLHSFDVTDGYSPQAPLVQVTNGKFYGTTTSGGANDDGTVFSLSVGLGPFVETQTTSGKVGAVVKILGIDLTGATSVRFNGTPAVFKVILPSLISTTVPEGATSGFVTVTTPSGTLKSNVRFQVRP